MIRLAILGELCCVGMSRVAEKGEALSTIAHTRTRNALGNTVEVGGRQTLGAGTILHATYCLERLVGEGGMGAVYEASHLRLRRKFAVKVLTNSATLDVFERFQREALITSELGHPHIVEAVDFNQTSDGHPYLVMELLKGENLSERLDRIAAMGVQMPLADATEIVGQATSALSAAHRGGVVHRDLKPSNIFLCERPRQETHIKLLDFGVSKMRGAPLRLTAAEQVIGTPWYMAPEQAMGNTATLDQRADIFSLGTIIYHMLTGTLPFEADAIPMVLYQVCHQDPAPVSSLRPDLPGALGEVVAKALAKEPGRRYQTMDELWADFASCVEAPLDPSLRRRKAVSATEETPRVEDPRAPEGSEPLATEAVVTPEPAAPRRRRARLLSRAGRWRWVLGGVGFLALFASLAAFGVRRPFQRPMAAVGSGPGGVTPHALDRPRRRPEEQLRRIVLSSEPSDVEVRLGGEAWGRTPLELEFALADRLLLGLSEEGYRRWSLPPGALPSRLHAVLEPLAAHALVSRKERPKLATPNRRARGHLRIGTLRGGRGTWAEVYLDGVWIGRSPLRKALVVGRHLVRVKRAGVADQRRWITVRAGREQSVLFEWR